MSFRATIIRSFRSLPSTHKVAVSSLAVLCVLLLLMPAETVVASKHTEAHILEAGKRYPLDLPELNSTLPSAGVLEASDWVSYRVRSGDTLAKIFKRAGLTPRDTYEVTQVGDLAKRLIALKPGEEIAIKRDSYGRLEGVEYVFSPTEKLTITAQYSEDADAQRSFSASIVEKPVDIRHNFAQGEIDSNFWNAGVDAGLTDNQIMQLAGIFGWDIDFASEIRSGDTFNIVFEEKYIDGEFVGHGDIVAAEFVNQNEEFNAIRYTDGNYYTAEGRSMRKSFLRAPVHFTRVSSNFNPRRFHPVQKRWKAHRGTDYVAPVGTPIMSAGDGKVIRSGYDKYNGHHVFIQHGEKYTTKYLHFKKRAVKVGETVKQGQVIGYLGSSGMVTGAHLHYEFLVDGVHRNPRTVELPKADPINPKERAEFEQLASLRLEQLSHNKRIMLAMN
ncbi:peptidoglycan DD-metalloendopeptidase family protein [Alteromonas flava]|uniref:peptidoglycan DD-metalloendopeptidase family protein n=1 Tax=Alteromonas flava TaxID=2048003 RepID=UPI000C28B8BE|nr:peptidoglycan DD-metalloendopeptidase family protein [Alteromonas flava]